MGRYPSGNYFRLKGIGYVLLLNVDVVHLNLPARQKQLPNK